MCDWHHYWTHLGSVTLSKCLNFYILLPPIKEVTWQLISVCLPVCLSGFLSIGKVTQKQWMDFNEIFRKCWSRPLFNFDDVPDSRWYFDLWAKNKSKGALIINPLIIQPCVATATVYYRCKSQYLAKWAVWQKSELSECFFHVCSCWNWLLHRVYINELNHLVSIMRLQQKCQLKGGRQTQEKKRHTFEVGPDSGIVADQ